jgi:hypothetical protein
VVTMLVFWVVMLYVHISIFRAEDGGSMFAQNIGNHVKVHTALQPRSLTRAIFLLCVILTSNPETMNTLITGRQV